MNEIKILELKLRNFKGIKELKLSPGGKNINIYGENATGKTTIMDSFLWLLFDKDSQNSSQFNVKTLDNKGNPMHGLEHEVVAKIEIDSKEIELQKIYKEKWTKKKGQAESELTSHTTEHFVNGVPKKKKEYTEYLAQIINEDTFKILTNPSYFNNNLNWKDRRSIALNICGDLEDKEVIDQDKKLKDLKDLLKDKSIDDLKAEMSSRRKKLNEELKSIPYRIDELSREVEEVDIDLLNKEKKVLEEKLNELKNSKSVDYDFRLRGINGSIAMLGNEIKDLERTATEEIRANLDSSNKAKYNLEKSVNDSDSKAFKINNNAIGLRELIDKIEKEISELKEKFKDIKVTEFKKESTICPTCQQELQSEKVDSLITEFENNKTIMLKNINETGKQKKEKLEKAQEELKQSEKELEEIKEELEATKGMLEGKNKEVAEYEKEIENIDIRKTQEYKERRNKIEELEIGKVEVEENIKDRDHTDKIKEFENRILEINKDLAKVDLAEQNEIRVNELLKREKEVAQMVAETEKTEFLCDQYVISKSNLLENKLNSKFNLVKFKLFDLQVNGGINETFITTVDGVPFEDLNNAMKINAGLDIINTLTDYYNFKAPIFIDNRESVNKIIDVKSQVINLIVSKDKKLKMEVEK